MLQKKSLFLVISLLFGFSQINAQSGKTFAVVVGISAYQNQLIPKLNYADKDAKIFADWLKSKAGGSVPDYQIKLLTNEQATVAAVYEALDWLKVTARENDTIYLYFSGHGDVEVDDSTSQGYLLAWNSPPNNYRNNAIAIADINADANIYTITNKANVILITDACHSGKLAGDFYKGKQLTANNLQLVLNNQVRLASCKTDQEAAEGIAWGGGRGVFSYYLLMGLNGLANNQHNGLVKLESLNAFLDSAFATDKTLLSNHHQQNPVIDGNPQYPMALVDTATLRALKNNLQNNKAEWINPPSGLQSLKTLGVQPMDAFFSILEQIQPSEFDFTSYMTLPSDSFPVNLLSDYLRFKEKILAGDRAGIEDWLNLFYTLDDDDLQALTSRCRLFKSVIARFNEKFVRMIHNNAQDMINAYLKGDIAELEKRQYYSEGYRSYLDFIIQIKLALKLVPENDHLAGLLKVQYHYIAGLTDRLYTALQTNTDSLVQSAFFHQHKAMELEPYAAYIHNEMGNLFLQKKIFDSADYHFNIASALSPTWAIPWSNKVRLNLAWNKPAAARLALQKAEMIQPNLAYVAVNGGLLMEKESNWLAAETYYLKAIDQNNVHYLPYERLGQIYILTGEYALADYYLTEAKRRKDEFAVNVSNFEFGIELGGMPPPEQFDWNRKTCLDDLSKVKNKQTAFFNLALIIQNSDTLDTVPEPALQYLLAALKQQPNIPLVNHYAGKLLLKQGHWEQAATILQNAIKYFKYPLDFHQELNDSFLKADPDFSDSCLFQFLIGKQYDLIEDYYLLGFALEKLGQPAEAIKYYLKSATVENKRQVRQALFSDLITEEIPGGEQSRLHTTAILIDKEHNRYRIQTPENKYFQLDNNEININVSNKPQYRFILSPLAPPEPENTKTKNIDTIAYDINEDTLVFTKYPGNTVININLPVYYKNPLRFRYNLYEYQTPMQMNGSLKAARLLEEMGDFKQAETVLLQQVHLNMEAGYLRDSVRIDLAWDNLYWLNINEAFEIETHNFYERMTQRFPRDFRWKEAAGLFLYNRLALSFSRVKVDEQFAFYESIDKWAYPFLPNEKPNEDIHFSIPGTDEKLVIPYTQYDPVKVSIGFLEQSVLLSGDVTPDFNTALAIVDLYCWTGNTEAAILQFQDLLIRQPENVSLRNKFIEYLQACKSYTRVQEQLSILYSQNQLTKDQRLQLASYDISEKKQPRAKQILDHFQAQNNEEKIKRQILYSQLYILDNQPVKALRYLEDSLKKLTPLSPANEINTPRDIKYNLVTDRVVFRYYTMARIYALLKNDKKALFNLKKAIASGFNLKQVLDTDPAWQQLRANALWKKLISQSSFEEIDYIQIVVNLGGINSSTIDFRVPKRKKIN